VTNSPKKTKTSKPSKRIEVSTDYSESATAHILKRQSSCKSITSQGRSYYYENTTSIDPVDEDGNFDFVSFNKLEEM
jgi:hypothetical protein